jgi:hypothetical protein
MDTVEYGEWLANFPSQDHLTAELLTSALHYLDESTFRSNLTEQILRDFDSGLITPPALVIPIRTGLEMGQRGPEPAVIFENVLPRDALRVPNTGSEALCANIIRNLEKGQGARLGMIPWPHTLDDLRIQKVRSVVLVGDYAGSGTQAIDASKIWTRNRSVRSWRSYGLVRIHVIVHSASVAAKEALDRERSVDRLSMVGVAPDFDSAGWTAEQRKDVEDFCARFARHRGKDVLGWKGSAALFVMQHKAPNNLPTVLWQTKGPSRRRGGWYPLLPDGRVPGRVAEALAAQGQQRRDSLDRRPGRDRVLGPTLLPVLAALQQGARTPDRISAMADIPLADSTRVLAELVDGGYVDPRGYMTDLGRKLLTPDARAMGRYRLSGSDNFYYPQALRRAGDI